MSTKENATVTRGENLRAIIYFTIAFIIILCMIYLVTDAKLDPVNTQIVMDRLHVIPKN